MSRNDKFGLVLLGWALFMMGMGFGHELATNWVMIIGGLSGICGLIGVVIMATLDRRADR